MILIGLFPTLAVSDDTTPILTIDAGHAGLDFLVFAPNGQWFASAGGSDGTVKLWGAVDGRLIRTLEDTQNSDVRSISVSTDSRLVAVRYLKSGIKIWEAASGKLVRGIETNGSFDVLLTRDSRSVIAVVPSASAIGEPQNILCRWDVETGEVQRTLLSVKDQIDRLALSADERRLAVAAMNGESYRIDVVELPSGRVSATMRNAHKRSVESLAWSPDGLLLVSGSHDSSAKVWDATTGRLLRTLGAPSYVKKVTFSKDGRMLALVTQGIRLLDAASWQLLREIPSDFGSAAFAPNGASIASGDIYGHITQWNVATGEKLYSARGVGLGIVSVSSLPANQWLNVGPDGITIWDGSTARPVGLIEKNSGFTQGHLATARDAGGATYVATKYRTEADGPLNTTKIWNVESGRLHRAIAWGAMKNGSSGIGAAAMSEDGRWLAASADGMLKIWDITSGRVAFSPATHSKQYGELGLLFSRDNKTLFAQGSSDDFKSSLWHWSLETGKLTKSAPLSRVFYNIIATTPDGHSLVAFEGKGNDKIINLLSVDGRIVHSFGSAIGGFLHDVAFSPDGRFAAAAISTKPNLIIYELATGNEVRSLEGNLGVPNSIAYSSDGRQLTVGNSNGTSAVWDVQSGNLLVTTVHQASGEWLSITPEGFFAASERGAELLHAVSGFKTISVDQFYQALYRPDLVREKLAGDPRGLVRDAAAQVDLNKVIASGEVPDVRLTLPGRAIGPVSVDSDSVEAQADVADRGGGIGRVEWRVNGVTVGVDTPATGTASLTRLSRSLALDPGGNAIEVIAYNGANLIASIPARLSVTLQVPSPLIVPAQPAAPGDAPAVSNATAKPRLFVLVAGVNDYADKRIQLSYAVPDAREVARGLREASGTLYRSVDIKLMTDAEVTRDKLDAAFAEMGGRISASDVFVLYLAGHGKTVDGRYYFIPQDFTIDGEFNDRAVNASVKAKAIAQDQLQRWFASVPARRSVILFDTCDSGTLAGDETQQLEKGAANDRLAQATGRSILTASGGAEEALEGYRGHGLFTYEVLDALNQADGDRNGTIELNELAAYVYAQVAELSQKVFKQRQVPQMKITANYPLAKQTRILRDETAPVAEGKPAYQISQATQLQIQPTVGATVVRNLSARSAVTVLESRNGWSLVASDGKPIGYVATKDLNPLP